MHQPEHGIGVDCYSCSANSAKGREFLARHKWTVRAAHTGGPSVLLPSSYYSALFYGSYSRTKPMLTAQTPRYRLELRDGPALMEWLRQVGVPEHGEPFAL